MTQWLNVGVKGHAAWPNKKTIVKFSNYDIVLKPATKTTEQSIHVELKRSSNIDALTLINRFLSILSWCDDSGMEIISEFSGSTIPAAVPKQIRSVGASITFHWNRDIENNKKTRLALALYREALTINSFPFSFLSYFKILNIFWDDKLSKKGTRAITEGIRDVLTKIDDTQAQKRLEELSRTQKDVAGHLNESGRCAIAHANKNPIVDPDNATDLRRLSKDRPVIRAIATYLIEKELKVSKSILG